MPDYFHLTPSTMAPPHVAQGISGNKRSSFYSAIDQGLIPPGVPVSPGGRKKAWPIHELERINKARAAGAGNEAIRTLVSEIVAARSQGGAQ